MQKGRDDSYTELRQICYLSYLWSIELLFLNLIHRSFLVKQHKVLIRPYLFWDPRFDPSYVLFGKCTKEMVVELKFPLPILPSGHCRSLTYRNTFI